MILIIYNDFSTKYTKFTDNKKTPAGNRVDGSARN